MVIELLKAVLFGIVEGITEWLPISSTGHLILLNQFVTLEVSDQFQSMFDVVIQLGAILAVIVIFFHKLNPFSPKKSYKAKKATWDLWFKVIVAIIPSGIVGILLDDWMDAHLHNATVVSIALIVYGIACKTGASRMTIVLSGVAVSSFLGAFTDAILTFIPDTQMNRMAFLVGSFASASMEQVKFAGGCILLGVAAAMVLSYDMNVLALGEETASSLGMRTGLYRMAFLAIAALLAGSAVSFSGLIGFVGLIVPHAARVLVGQDNRYLIPLCALLGGAFTLGCDIAARTLFAPFEIPVGIVMSFLGGPFFIYLLLSRKGRRALD